MKKRKQVIKRRMALWKICSSFVCILQRKRKRGVQETSWTDEYFVMPQEAGKTVQRRVP